MPVINELIRTEANGTISFGNYLLDNKTKADEFEYNGDLYKVKTFKEITKLERNGRFVYESVPGTAVKNLDVKEQGMKFSVVGLGDSQITVELEADTEYKIFINDTNVGKMKTNLGGKLVLSVELGGESQVEVKIVKL
ncbi:MAG: endosialidase [Clostridiales bacterium]|nr:endosialidase [Clostridiales bacterium]